MGNNLFTEIERGVKEGRLSPKEGGYLMLVAEAFKATRPVMIEPKPGEFSPRKLLKEGWDTLTFRWLRDS